MTNGQIIDKWMDGESFKGDKLSTDGKNLYSYVLCIGTTNEGGLKIVKDFTKENRNSPTTTRHIVLAKRACGVSITPTIGEVALGKELYRAGYDKSSFGSC